MTEEEYRPVNGSWVAELEAAREALATMTSSLEGRGAEERKRRGGQLILANVRLCRAHSMLRQWEKLRAASARGLKVCATHKSRSAAARIAEDKARFASYREQSKRELSVPSCLDLPKYNEFFRGIITGKNEPNACSGPALLGDMRLLETTVAHGAALDMPVVTAADPFPAHRFDWAPSDATELVVVCAALAAYDLDCAWHDAATLEAVDRSTECAMQLVRLGADPTRTLNLNEAPDTERSRGYRRRGFDGKTALELARMSERAELVELMEQHLRYTPEERAQVVHCRCGSRLPWTACHSTGIGQPPHYLGSNEMGSIMYRVSPLARCPCRNTAWTHYECCWKDTSSPAYLADTGYLIRAVPISGGLGSFDAFVGTESSAGNTAKDRVEQYASLLRSDPDALEIWFATHEGQVSRVASWDPEVYAGCLERLGDGDKDDFFLWTDLHWKVDKSELLRRAEAWNKALKQYCRDKGLVGEERAHVIAKHKANPCAPCGYSGCKACEKEPKEFRRCSTCKLIAYCGPACQKKDWAEHQSWLRTRLRGGDTGSLFLHMTTMFLHTTTLHPMHNDY